MATQVIGLDIGGTSVKGIVTDGSGKIMARSAMATDAKRGRDAILETVHALISDLLQQQPAVKAIGIGTAGRVNVDTGEVVFATDNLPGWQGTNLVEWTRSSFQLPSAADNDGNTALLGEAWLGAGRNLRHIIMLTLGTGVGGANMIHGELFRGANWNGGEWGHSLLIPGGYPCNCGQAGCVEQYLSGNSLVKIANECTGKTYRSGMEFMNDVELGEKQAVRVMKQYVERLSALLSGLQAGFDPEAFIIGGGVIHSQSIWWPLLEDQLKQSSLPTDVRPAQLGNDAGSFGAAKLVLQMISIDAKERN